jgi:hypothetical protein
VKLAWKEARPEAEGKLFYSAEMLAQVAIAPGLMRQTALLDYKVMQGELKQVALLLQGEGEVTRVQGAAVLAWNLEPAPGGTGRRLVVQFNQAQKDQFALQLQVQTPLGAFPQAATVLRLQPENATRFAGYVRIVNEGAVRLEVLQASGVSQISPDQFPETDATRAALPGAGSQRFAFRFSGPDYQLRLQADNILPELSVSHLLAYHLGETELDIDDELELEIREAPLRELLLRIPKGYAIARLNASGLNDYFVSEPADQPLAELRLVYGQPVSGRQVVQLRLERNQPLAEATWALPPLEVLKAKSVRGHIGVSADPGYRLTPALTQGLTELATAFFPRKLAGIQAAFRISDPAWKASLRVERLPQSIEADAMHLFSVGEGIAYGSSLINYVISGAPLATFRFELADENANVEFTGKDIRNWHKTGPGTNQVQLHTPVAGAYSLLVTYERAFKSQGATLAFTGARPLDAQSERGHTLVISTYQFQVRPVSVSAGLTLLEPAEVPAEYRLFFDAPILAAYRYVTRPFNLQLELSPLRQGETLSQVMDRAALTTRISKEGQVLTDARYFLKNRGLPHLRLQLPEGLQLWSATVNGATVVPVKDAQANLIPLPQRSDPNAIHQLDLKLAARSATPRRVTLSAPIVFAPVLLTEWRVWPDAGQRLAFRRGSLTPAGGVVDNSGFAGLAALFGSPATRETALTRLAMGLALIFLSVLVWRWSSAEGAYRFSPRQIAGAVIGLAAAVLGIAVLVILADQAGTPRPVTPLIEQTANLPAQQSINPSIHQSSIPTAPGDLTFLAPVQQSGTALTLEVRNLPQELSGWDYLGRLWPALLALAVWIYTAVTTRSWLRPGGIILGWTLLCWAALRWPHGAPAFFAVLIAFLLVHALFPALRRVWQLPRRPRPAPPAEPGVAPAAAALIVLLSIQILHAGSPAGSPAYTVPPLAQAVMQEIRVEGKFAFATAKIQWQAARGQVLPLLFEPAVLTSVVYPTNALQLVPLGSGAKRGHQLRAATNGAFEVELRYQLQVGQQDGESGFALPTQYGLVNWLKLTLANLDVDVRAPQAVSIQREPAAGTNTLATLVLSPVNEAWIGWKPRSRDPSREKAVFYAELFQLYVPAAGVIEGVHLAQIRPAHGEISELSFQVPPGATVTDVQEPAMVPADAKQNAPARALISVWRFDPDTRLLRVSLNPPQAKPFALLIKSQVPTGPLPFTQKVGLITVPNAAGQIGLVGIATGSEVQLDNVLAEPLSTINLEDFPPAPLQALRPQVAGLTLRRACRYTGTEGTLTLQAAAVEPDVRVETQETLSLGEDRTVLADNLSVEITRAGIFRLTFVLPAGLEVETISGAALSHWTELKTGAGRLITLHLRGKTEGKQSLAINLAGPGIRPVRGWAVPRLVLREAGKQQGQLLLIPEQGLRLQPAAREGLTQLDPQRSGIRQKGVLAFRLLHAAWSLALDIEQVAPWVQVASLQHVTLGEAQLKVAANLQYQIENTGLKALRVTLPAAAENVRFRGEQLADFLPRPGPTNAVSRDWDIKLHRRVVGKYLLQLSYQVSYQARLPEQAREAVLDGVQARDVDLQRGFLTLEAGGRLEVRVDKPPVTLQPTEWQSIPRALQQDIAASSASYAYRLVEPNFQLPVQIERHQVARLLPARVTGITLTSVISDNAEMLTQARLQMVPGDKRLLHLRLPAGARFWFAFVNQHSVSPWLETNEILVPLEQQSRTSQGITVEFFYSSQAGAVTTRSPDFELWGPKFDLPLENITWRVFLNEKWRLKDWTGTLQLKEKTAAAYSEPLSVETYLSNEVSQQKEKTREAEQLLQMGNTMLQKGDPQQARRAFQAAYGISTHDDAFNEDARVQLHNLKLQQALVGLNFRQAGPAGEAGAAADKVQSLRGRKAPVYTQQEAKELLGRNTEEDNTALTRLAERLIQQQDAAVANPAAIRTTIPGQGRLLTFARAVLVDPWASLNIGLKVAPAKAASWGLRLLLLAAIFAGLSVFAWVARGRRV